MRASLSLLLLAVLGCRPEADLRAPDEDTAPARRLRVAVTVDDLPSHGPRPEGLTRRDLHERLLAAFAKHEVEAYGFINGARAADGDDERAALQAWADAGQPLANHTFSHPRMQDIGLAAYLAEIDANAAVLAALEPDAQTWHVFRYPYLYEGTDPQSTIAVREHLAHAGYRIAQVTVDFYDWSFNDPYVRCLGAHDEAAIARLRTTYLDHAVAMLRWSDEAAQQLWQRDVGHILLLHVGALTAELIEPLLAAYEAEGVTWIPLAEAMADPIYATPPVLDGETQGTFIDQTMATRPELAITRVVQPLPQLASFCPVTP
ncbi:MAG TPA: polysaccharide deacetylase family protein [Nannocystaceae bacterium]|nr:polysaccharide deacetylase family protein [Nannocystaceae bacterium]